MSFLVVGASGFLGRATCMELLRAGHVVSGTWRVHPDRLPEGLADSFEESELETRPTDADVVIACSARIPYGAMNQPDPGLSEANIGMPLRLSRRFPKSRLVLASSVAIYGRAPSPRTEESAFVAPDEYGWTKLAAEAVVRQHPRFGIVRFSSLYGPGMRATTFLPTVVKTARESGRIVLFGDGMRTQDYLHVFDAARMLGIVATQPQSGTFLGASGQAASNRDVAAIVARALPGTEIRFEGTDDSPSVCYDVSATRHRTGFTPALSMDEGIRTMVSP